MQHNTKRLDIVIPLLGVTRGGGIRVISELANGLCLRGHSITLITPPIGCFPFPLVKQVRLISRTKTEGEGILIGRCKDFIFVTKTAAKTGSIILSNYYTTFFIGWLLTVFSKRKHVYFIQGYEAEFFDTKQKFANNIKTVLAKLSYTLKPDLRITISQFIKNKIGKNDTIIIDDGIDPAIFKSLNIQKTSAKKIISTIALTERRKGFYDFVKAIEILKRKRSDFDVLLFTSQTGARFDLPFAYHIKYPKNDKEIVECMQNSDIFISASHLEGFGLPGLEAMACGAALITTNSGGVTQYAEHEVNSLIIDVGDVEALAAAIERMLDDPGFIEKMVRGGLSTSANFTWAIMSEKFEKALIQLQ